MRRSLVLVLVLLTTLLGAPVAISGSWARRSRTRPSPASAARPSRASSSNRPVRATVPSRCSSCRPAGRCRTSSTSARRPSSPSSPATSWSATPAAASTTPAARSTSPGPTPSVTSARSSTGRSPTRKADGTKVGVAGISYGAGQSLLAGGERQADQGRGRVEHVDRPRPLALPEQHREQAGRRGPAGRGQAHRTSRPRPAGSRGRLPRRQVLGGRADLRGTVGGVEDRADQRQRHRGHARQRLERRHLRAGPGRGLLLEAHRPETAHALAG